LEYLTNEDKRILEKLHKTELGIFDELVRICDTHNLKYFLYGGTLLGAVRHGGFIPWDDDMDIAMLRDDYEKFGEYCKTDLNEKYFYQTCYTDPEYSRPYAKLRLNNSYVKEEEWDSLEHHKGIYIDIMPLDNFPENIQKGIKILKKVRFINGVCNTNNINNAKPWKKFVIRLLRILPKQFYYDLRRKLLKKSHASKSDNVCSFASHYVPIIKRVLKKAWFEGNEYMTFEGKSYRVPCGWKEYLIHLFGENYMELPPVEKRETHFNFHEVKFDINEEVK
jgi:lipopolysaccharide cholinephosphotransferase